jgi:hypothetical protein
VEVVEVEVVEVEVVEVHVVAETAPGPSRPQSSATTPATTPATTMFAPAVSATPAPTTPATTRFAPTVSATPVPATPATTMFAPTVSATPVPRVTLTPAARPAASKPRRARLAHGHGVLRPDQTYIGRGSSKHGLGPSVWENPFAIGKDGEREVVIAKFAAYLQDNEELQSKLGELSGMTLLCHCGPREPCHADVLIKAFSARFGTEGSDGPTSDEDEFGDPKARLGAGWHGKGRPIQIGRGALRRDFRDGGGLCSPGNWPPHQRVLPPLRR